MRTIFAWMFTSLKPITLITLWLGLIGVVIVATTPAVDETVGNEPPSWAIAMGSKHAEVREAAVKRFLAAGPKMCPLLEATALNGNEHQIDSVLKVLQELYRSPRPEYHMAAEETLNRLQDSSIPDVTLPTIASWSSNRKLRINRCAARFEELGGSVRIDESQWNGPTSDFRRATTAILDENWSGGDEGLEHIRRMPGLQVLEVTRDANVSKAALIDFQKQCPGVTIIHRGAASMGVEGVEQSQGFLVVSVTPGGGAEKAGLKPRDFILIVGDVSASSFQDVANHISEHAPGDVVPMTIRRGHAILELDVTLGSRD